MSRKPEFTKEGYQKDLKDIGGEPLPGTNARRLSKKEVDELGIPSPDEVLQALRSKPARGYVVQRHPDVLSELTEVDSQR
jgi:hypothetical protein